MPTKQVSLEKELANSYLQYAVSTFNRAIPNAIDGLLISHRRILNTMFAHNMTDWYKTASASGMVIAERHPHGSASGAIYGLASKASNMVPLLDGYGNIGGHIYSGKRAGQMLSDDGPAADRYTKVKLSEFAIDVFDIESEFLESTPSYTNKHTEILQYVPALPLALINAQQSVGVGYACNSISFNLANIAKAIKYALDGDNNKSAKALGVPDLTVFSNIDKNGALIDLHKEGRATLKLVGTYSVEDIKLDLKRNAWRKAIYITELPSGSAEKFLTKLKKACDEYKVTTIAEANDLSDGEGIKIELIGKYGESEETILPELLKHTTLSSTYSVNSTFVLNGMPTQMSPLAILLNWLDARKQVLKSKFESEIIKMQNRLHILDALVSNLPFMQDIVQDIMQQDSEQLARTLLESKYNLDAEQAKAILAISLKQLVKLNKDAMLAEQTRLLAECKYLQNMLNDAVALNGYILHQTEVITKKYKQNRRTNQTKIDITKEIKQESDILTTRQSYLAETSLADKVAKALYKYYNKGTLIKPFIGKPLNKISQDLDSSITELFKDKKPAHKAIQKWAESYNLEPLDDKWAKKLANNKARLEQHIVYSLNKKCK